MLGSRVAASSEAAPLLPTCTERALPAKKVWDPIAQRGAYSQPPQRNHALPPMGLAAQKSRPPPSQSFPSICLRVHLPPALLSSELWVLDHSVLAALPCTLACQNRRPLINSHPGVAVLSAGTVAPISPQPLWMTSTRPKHQPPLDFAPKQAGRWKDS